MFGFPFGFSVLRLGIYAAVALGLVAGLYTGYRVWRGQIWKEGRDAALAAVAAQNGAAANAAKIVEVTSDLCFDKGGTWSVITGECDLDPAH